MVSAVAWLTSLGAELNRFLDAKVVDGGFDKGCEEISTSGGLLSQMQNGRVQTYLRILALALVGLAAILIWSSRA
jgi:NADH-quinone oxidoreductase subunit L